MSQSSVEEIKQLLKEINHLVDNFDEAKESDRGDVHPARAPFLAALRKLTTVIRDAERSNIDNLGKILEDVDNTVSHAIDNAVGNDDDYLPFEWEELVPSFADDGQVLEDQRKTGLIPPGTLLEMIHIFSSLDKGAKLSQAMNDQIAVGWDACLRPSNLSSKCARFLDPIPNWTATEQNQNATYLFRAECEILDTQIASPVKALLSPSSRIFAVTAMGGWKNRTPFLFYHYPQHTSEGNGTFSEPFCLETDLTSFVSAALLDEDSGLAFVADDSRIKSYKLATVEANDSKSWRAKDGLPVHTLASGSFTGPMVLRDQKILRAGKGKVGVWDLTSVKTHGKKGTRIIGKELDELDTWRDVDDEIERSSGSKPSTTLTLDIKEKITLWQAHPSASSVMLCGIHEESKCHSFDIQAGGKVVSRYLGHGGAVAGISTASEPNTFLTWCDDGHARLYDTRSALPVVTINCSPQSASASAGALAYPNGVPFVFTATLRDEEIKVWDLRSRKLLYELATGNNAVGDLVWDDRSNALYAATSSEYVDRMGYHHDYRKAKLPKKAKDTTQDDEDEDMDDEDDEEEEDYEWEYGWPKRALHNEDYFGHTFDAGDARLYKYSFKANPDLQKLPRFGDLNVSRGDYF